MRDSSTGRAAIRLGPVLQPHFGLASVSFGGLSFAVSPRNAAVGDGTAPLVGSIPKGTLGAALSRYVASLSDDRLSLVVSAVLFALAAWPLLLVEVPPFQDLPNHLATVTVIDNPQLYPEFAFNGFLKTNAALFAWLVFAGRVVGVKLAAKLFTAMVLAVGSLVYPRFILEVAGRKKMLVASLFVWPMIHNWFVSMGMLDFALGVPLSLATLLFVKRVIEKPTPSAAAGVVVFSLATWYAHVFALLVVLGLVAFHFLERALRAHLERRGVWKGASQALPTTPHGAWRAAALLTPAAVATAIALFVHLTEPQGMMSANLKRDRFLSFWELVYNMWAEWAWGFTKLSITSLVPCVVLGLVLLFHLRSRRGTASPLFFSTAAFVVLAAGYVFGWYEVTNWFHVNSRVIPFLWIAMLLRVPDRLPRVVVSLLGVSALLYSAGMGYDYVRLDRERLEFTAGMSVVPDNARLLPLVSRGKHTSENTRNLLHAWGFYVAEKKTSAPLLFAHSRSFPVMYRDPPPARFNHLMLEGFAMNMAHPRALCGGLYNTNIQVGDCPAMWHTLWQDFWREAEPHYTHVLLWDAADEVKAEVPPQYKVVYASGHLTIYERPGGALPAPKAPPATLVNESSR